MTPGARPDGEHASDPVAAPPSGAPPRRRGRPPASDGARTRERILQVARDVFSDLGYEKASFMEIAHRAGVTRPAVNHYFGSKEALYGALFDATRDSVVDAGVANAMNEHKLTRQIGAFLEAAAQVDSRDRTHARFIAASVLDSVRHPELNDRALGQLAEVRVFLEQALRTAIERGEIRQDLDTTAVTEMLIAILWGMGLYAGYVGTHQQLDSVVQQFTRLLEGDLW